MPWLPFGRELTGSTNSSVADLSDDARREPQALGALAPAQARTPTRLTDRHRPKVADGQPDKQEQLPGRPNGPSPGSAQSLRHKSKLTDRDSLDCPDI